MHPHVMPTHAPTSAQQQPFAAAAPAGRLAAAVGVRAAMADTPTTAAAAAGATALMAQESAATDAHLAASYTQLIHRKATHHARGGCARKHTHATVGPTRR